MNSLDLQRLNLGMPNNALDSLSSPLPVHSPSAPSLNPLEQEIVRIVHQHWPTSSLEIAEHLGHSLETREQKRTLSSRLSYHLKKLVEKRILMSKRSGNTRMVWPYEVEKFRLMHELFPHSPSHSDSSHENPLPIDSDSSPPKGVQ
jgi:hypothetical protein